MTEKDRMLAQQLYMSADPELEAGRARAKKLCRQYNNTTEEEIESRMEILQELLGSKGENIWIEPTFWVDYGSNICIGENFYANYDCIIVDVARVEIGKNVMFGPRVCLYTAGHPLDVDIRLSGLEFGRNVTIGDNVWIGGNTVINPGVTIGNNTVIGSGSVVTKDIPDNVIAAGVPCRVIREISEEDKNYWKKQADIYYASLKEE